MSTIGVQLERSLNIHDIKIQCLVIESDQETVTLLKDRMSEWFDRRHFKIHLANNLTVAEKALRQTQFDLIITDIRFPGDSRTPRQVIEFLRSLPGMQDTILIALSELPGAGLQVESLIAGVDEYFTTDIKTIPPAVIQYRFKRIVEQIKKRKYLEAQTGGTAQPIPSPASQSQAAVRQSVESLQQELRQLQSQYEELESSSKNLENENSRLMQAFRMYVDPAIIQNIILGDPLHWQKGERKNITILFSDLRGYTRMSSKMSSENVINFLNEYFTAMTEVIMGYHGMIDKYMGDGIMCLFGAPVDNPDHSFNAIEAAIEMQNVFELWLPSWEKNYGIKPAQGIGLATGDAVVGNLGGFQKISYTAVGSVVNLASRLEGLAGPGDICISEELYNNLSPEFLKQHEFEPLTPIPIKGMDGRHHIYRLTGEIDLDNIVVQS